jgi:RING-like zinc finger
MSDSGAAGYKSTSPSVGFNEVMIAVGGIVGCFVFLLFLRFCCNMLIDICILQDFVSVRRSCGEVRRLFCPCWRPRTQPLVPGTQTGSPENQATSDLEMGSRLTAETLDKVLESTILTHAYLQLYAGRCSNVGVGFHHMERPSDDVLANACSRAGPPKGSELRMLDAECENCLSPSASLSTEQQRSPRESRSPSTPGAENERVDDMSSNSASERRPSSTSSTLTCAICICELSVGQKVIVTPRCGHIFHRECLHEWIFLSCSRNDEVRRLRQLRGHTVPVTNDRCLCPNCRAAIL